MIASKLERAVERACGAVERGGELPIEEQRLLFKALVDAGGDVLAAVCFRTAALCAVEPQMPSAIRSSLIEHLEAHSGLIAKLVGDPRTHCSVPRRMHAVECVIAAELCVRAPGAERFMEMLQAFRRAHFRAQVHPEDRWYGWLEDTVLAAPEMNASIERLSLLEALQTPFPERADWRFAALTRSELTYALAQADHETDNIDPPFATATLQLQERQLTVTLSVQSKRTLGRVRALHLAQFALLRVCARQRMQSRYDALVVIEPGVGSWSVHD